MENKGRPSKSSVKQSKAVKRARNRSEMDNIGQKKRKIETEEPVVPIELIEPIPLKLVDINNDCLQSIFELLSVRDLINVAEADDQFIPAATEVYSRRHRKKSVEVLHSLVSYEHKGGIKLGKNLAPACFRHFGHLISDLSINFQDQRDIEIELSVGKYCQKSLHSLKLKFCDENHFETMKKPFVNVEKLTIIGGELGRKLLQVNLWFPNLVSLKLIEVELIEPKLIEVNLPRLQHLTIYECMFLSSQTVSKVVRFNPQLKSLILRCNYDVDLLHSVAIHLVQLEKLTLWTPADRFLRFYGHTIRFETVTEFTLNAMHTIGDFVHYLPFEFDRVQKLKLNGLNRFDGHILNFIGECGSVSKLNLVPSIRYIDDLIFDDVEWIIRQLPELIELEFCADDFTQMELSQLLTDSKKLKRVHLMFVQQPLWDTEWFAGEDEWTAEMQRIDILGCFHEVNGINEYFRFTLNRKE